MKRMLINATQPEELRVAIADGQHLLDLDIEVPSQEQKKANIYKGRITRVEPSLEACFVNYGSERHGFLPLKEISRKYFQPGVLEQEGRISVRDAVKEGQEIIVQVAKEERGNKGAALTTFISLAGRYMVLMPTNPRAGGVSRRISGEERQAIRDCLSKLDVPDGMGLIVRTAGVGRDEEELQWDMDYLLQLWMAIEKAAEERAAPFLIYQESNLIIRALRDYLRNDIGEILIDKEAVFNDAREFMQQVMPHNLRKLKPYRDPVPLFSRFQIESQIESAFAREVKLPSGGSLVIDHTEAMLAIDINSARATKGSDIEETAYLTNLEAAEEIARQLRLRDLGGLIVIDFIDMNDRRHQREVEDRLREHLRLDKARIQIGRISRFGLLEMSRQRLRPSLGESSQEPCPRCDGHGHIRSIESLALSILRLMEEEAMKEFTGQIIVQAPVEVANFLGNEKREAVSQIEKRHTVPVIVVANTHFDSPRFEIRRVRKNDVTDEASYAIPSLEQSEIVATEATQSVGTSQATPAVSGVTPAKPAPDRPQVSGGGLFSALLDRLKMLFGSEKQAKRPPRRRQTRKATTKSRHKGKPKSRRAHQPRGQQSQSQQNRQQAGSRRGSKKVAKKTRRKAAKRQAQRGPSKASQSGKAQSGKPRSGKPQTGKPHHSKSESGSAQNTKTQDTKTQKNKSRSGKPQPDQRVKPNGRTAGDKTASGGNAGSEKRTDNRASTDGNRSRGRRGPYKTGNRNTSGKDAQQPAANRTEKPAQDTTTAGAVSPAPKGRDPKVEQPLADRTPKTAATNAGDKPAAEKQPTAAPASRARVSQPDSAAGPHKPATEQKAADRPSATDARTPGSTDTKAAPVDIKPKAATNVPEGLYTLKREDGALKAKPLKKTPLQESIEAARKAES